MYAKMIVMMIEIGQGAVAVCWLVSAAVVLSQQCCCSFVGMLACAGRHQWHRLMSRTALSISRRHGRKPDQKCAFHILWKSCGTNVWRLGGSQVSCCRRPAAVAATMEVTQLLATALQLLMTFGVAIDMNRVVTSTPLCCYCPAPMCSISNK